MPQFRIVPAGERLEPRNLSGMEMDQRLIGQRQATLRQCVAQTALDRKAALRFLENTVAIYFDLAAAFGDLDRCLRLANDVIGVIAQAGGKGTADRAIHPDLQVAQPDRRTQRFLDPLDDVKSIRQAIVQTGEYRKIIAADPRQHIALPQAGFQSLGDRDQQFVASHRAKRFIDPAEPAKVDRDDAELGIFGPDRIGDPVVNLFAKAGAIGQRGQPVGQKFAAQILLDRPFAGTIGRGEQVKFGMVRIGRQAADGAHEIFRPQFAIAANFKTVCNVIRLNEFQDAIAPHGRGLADGPVLFLMLAKRLQETVIGFDHRRQIVIMG